MANGPDALNRLLSARENRRRAGQILAAAAGGALLGGVLIALGGYGALAFGLPLFAFAAAGLALWPGDR